MHGALSGLALRASTAGALLALFVPGLLWLPNRGWAALLLIVLAVAAFEWGRLAGFGAAARAVFCALLAVSAAPLAALAPPELAAALYLAGCAFWLVWAPLWLAGRARTSAPLALAAAGWLALVPAWLALVRLQADPPRLLALLGVVWVADSAAYLAGSRWGRHALAPAISPRKSWEGVAGAAAAVAVYYVAVAAAAPEWRWWWGAPGAALVGAVALAGMVGDLFESALKRQAGTKDSGALLPGHGGVLDRIDSVIASMPLAAAVLLRTG